MQPEEWLVIAALAFSSLTVIAITIYVWHAVRQLEKENRQLKEYIALRDDQAWKIKAVGRHRNEVR